MTENRTNLKFLPLTNTPQGYIISIGDSMNNPENNKNCCKYKNNPRNDDCKKNLENRINRIIGQLGGIKKMIDEDRYCGDIIIQLSAAEKALENLGYIILKDHIDTCVSDKIRNGDENIVDETVELIKKLK